MAGSDLWTRVGLGKTGRGSGDRLAYACRCGPFRRVDFARPLPAVCGAVATSVPTGNRRVCGAAGRQGGAPPGARVTNRGARPPAAQIREAAMAVVSMKQLLDSGVHFGHQTRRWNPKMKRFIFTERNGIYIIDLQQTLGYIDNAYEFVKQTVAHGGSILFVGTKRQAQEVVAEQATRVGMPYVNQRWLGGMLTNF